MPTVTVLVAVAWGWAGSVGSEALLAHRAVSNASRSARELAVNTGSATAAAALHEAELGSAHTKLEALTAKLDAKLDAELEYKDRMWREGKKSWSSRCTGEQDYDIYTAWEKAGKYVVGWTVVPIMWRCIVETELRRGGDDQPMLRALKLMQRRDKSRRHVLLMMQADPNQAVSEAKRRGWKGNLDDVFGPDVTVFDTRLLGLFWAAHGVQGRPSYEAQLVPAPLLHRASPALGSQAPRSPARAVFWAGGCHGHLRTKLHRVLAKDNRYNFAAVRECGSKLSQSKFFESILENTWVLAPQGTYYASFIMYQALSLGRLPVLVVDFQRSKLGPERYNFNRSRTLNSSEILSHLPYADELDWNMLTVAVEAKSLAHLGVALAAKDKVVPDMLRYAASVRSRFTVDGFGDYMRRWLTAHQPPMG